MSFYYQRRVGAQRCQTKAWSPWWRVVPVESDNQAMDTPTVSAPRLAPTGVLHVASGIWVRAGSRTRTDEQKERVDCGSDRRRGIFRCLRTAQLGSGLQRTPGRRVCGSPWTLRPAHSFGVLTTFRGGGGRGALRPFSVTTAPIQATGDRQSSARTATERGPVATSLKAPPRMLEVATA